MLAGLPVVVSDIPGNRDLVTPGESGFLVQVGDSGEFARKVRILLDDPDSARKTGAAARQRMLTEFSVEKMVERHVGLYRELTQK